MTPRSGDVDLARSTAAMTALTLASRVTGLVRIAVVTAVLGDTFLGNTYQSANSVPNLLFELLAAGVLQATLIPTLVRLYDARRDDEADHVAGAVLGLAGAALAGLALIGALLAPWIVRGLLSGVPHGVTYDRQVRLGTILLWCFLPQVVLYAANTVSTAVLNARHRFGVPVFAPVLNNVVVTASYLLFAILRDGADPDQPLRGVEMAVLGLGTTLGVVAFCTLPFVSAVRGGARLRPNLDHAHPEMRRIARLGAWAALFLASSQVLLATVLVLANHVEGGVVSWQLAFTLFLLPHALVSLPVLTTQYPVLSRQHAAGDDIGFGRTVAGGIGSIAFLVLPATAALLTLGRPIADALRLGNFGSDGADQVAGALAAFGPGLLGYGGFLFLARTLYARGDTRTPALVNCGIAVVGPVAMVLSFRIADGNHRIAALAGAWAAVQLIGFSVLLVVVRGRVPTFGLRTVGRSIAGAAAAAAVAGTVMYLVRVALDPSSPRSAAVAVATAGAAGLVAYLLASPVLGGPRMGALPSVLRGHVHG